MSKEVALLYVIYVYIFAFSKVVKHSYRLVYDERLPELGNHKHAIRNAGQTEREGYNKDNLEFVRYDVDHVTVVVEYKSSRTRVSR